MSLLPLSAVISHRFRGFGGLENTLESFRNALDWGVEVVEFDVRIAKCGTPMVYHDEHAMSASGQRLLCEVMAKDYAEVGGRFASIPTLDALLELAASHANKVRLLVDIKDAGFEDAIRSLVRLHCLQDRVVYVTWLPEVLYAMHALEPEAPLCFSHWADEPGLPARSIHHVHVSRDGHVPRGTETKLGERSGWWLRRPLCGELLDILAKVDGYVCVPRPHLHHPDIVYYADHGVGTTAFSYVRYDDALKDYTELDLAMVFSDSKAVFDGVQATA